VKVQKKKFRVELVFRSKYISPYLMCILYMCDCFHFAVGKEECCCILKGELRRKMNLWSNKTSVPVNRSLRFVFMIIECKEFYL